jgi:hypothetical protein
MEMNAISTYEAPKMEAIEMEVEDAILNASTLDMNDREGSWGY